MRGGTTPTRGLVDRCCFGSGRPDYSVRPPGCRFPLRFDPGFPSRAELLTNVSHGFLLGSRRVERGVGDLLVVMNDDFVRGLGGGFERLRDDERDNLTVVPNLRRAQRDDRAAGLTAVGECLSGLTWPAFLKVRMSRTPGTATAASVLISRITPRAMLLVARQAKAGLATARRTDSASHF